jgi:ferredoxin-NADP reductase
LLIGGGIGITGLLHWVTSHWNVKLAWSVREAAKCFVNEVEGVLSGLHDKDVRIGSRLNVSELLAEELEAGWAKVGVVVCGPGRLCDNVRAAVVAASKGTKTVFQLEVAAYSW